MDHFLDAERFRARATAPAEAPGEGVAWRPNPELLKQAITHYEKALRLQPDHYWSHFVCGHEPAGFTGHQPGGRTATSV